jgi:hypothetical protein
MLNPGQGRRSRLVPPLRALAAALLLLVACGSEPAPEPAAPAEAPPAPAAPAEAPPAPAAAVPAAPAPQEAAAPLGNQLVNPGFEQGREGWSYRDQSPHWGDFSIVESPVHSGSRAAHLALRQSADAAPQEVKVHGVVQEISPASFPQRLGGFYRVERWEKSSPEIDLYMQAVVIVWGDPRTPRIVNPISPPVMLQNYQLRYYLAGVAGPAMRVANSKIEIVSRDAPPLGEWVAFDVPLRADFQRLWGVVPEGYEMLRLLFEARWDNLPAGGSVSVDVYYDDLYVE